MKTRDTRLMELGKRVEKELKAQPISDPIAAGAAVGSLYAQRHCTAQDAFDYMGMLANAASRLQETADRDDLLCRIAASCGSTLHTCGSEFALSFLDPEQSEARLSGTVFAQSPAVRAE